MSHKRKKKSSMKKQGSLFGGYRTMTLIQCLKECGRLKRLEYAKRIAYEKEQEKNVRTDSTGAQGNPLPIIP